MSERAAELVAAEKSEDSGSPGRVNNTFTTWLKDLTASLEAQSLPTYCQSCSLGASTPQEESLYVWHWTSKDREVEGVKHCVHQKHLQRTYL